MSRIRLMSGPSEDIDNWKKKKEDYFAKEVKSGDKPPALGGSCRCPSRPSTSTCPLTMTDVKRIADNGKGFNTRHVMASQACYIPVVRRGYMCEKIHKLALLGTERESHFMKLLQSEPTFAHRGDGAGNTPLMLACAARKVSFTVIMALLGRSSSVDVNAENQDGLTALHFAVLNNQPELMELLIANGADVDAGRVKVNGKYYGLTPLLVSVMCDAWSVNKCLDALLKYDPDLEVETLCGSTVDPSINLHFRIECDCGGCWSHGLLSAKGVVPPSQIKKASRATGGNAAHHAAKNCLGQHLRSLLDKFEVQNKLKKLLRFSLCDGGYSLLHIAVNCQSLGAMEAILEKCSSVVNTTMKCSSVVNTKMKRFRGHTKITPLHLPLLYPRCFKDIYTCRACSKTVAMSEGETTRIFSALLNCPAVNVKARTGRLRSTPLMLAAMNGHDYVIERLLDLGADLTAVDIDGHDPADLAVDLEPDICCKVLSALFKTGLSLRVSMQPFCYSSLLLRIAQKKSVQILKFIRQAGALSEPNRLAMFNATLTAVVEDQKEEEDNDRQFLNALETANPYSLQQSALMFVSARAEIGSPQMRKQALKKTIHKLMGNETDALLKCKKRTEAASQENHASKIEITRSEHGCSSEFEQTSGTENDLHDKRVSQKDEESNYTEVVEAIYERVQDMLEESLRLRTDPFAPN